MLFLAYHSHIRKRVPMSLTKFVKKDIFVILSIVLILCVFDQLYMMIRYKNISIETFVLTLFLTAISTFFGFLKD